MLPTIVMWILIAAAVLVTLVVVLVLIGSFLPRAHVVARSIQLGQPPEAVWQVITDFANVPTWHTALKRVERLSDNNGHAVWRETYKGGPPIQLETVEIVPPHRLVRSIADEKGPFSGRWEFAVDEEAAGSRVTITEHGVIPNPLVRFIARAFMDPAKYLEMYLTALAGRFGETAAIETYD
jgi:uncharacterized protein YndB with AHSA1/START domain